MKTSESIDKIAPAMLKAQSAAMRVGKSGQNIKQNYKYSKLEDYYDVCRNAFHENGIFIIESVVSSEPIDGRVTYNGNAQYATRIKITLTAIHESGQWISIDSEGEGQDAGDKGTYKAITGARKYGIAMAGNLSTSDDPEKDDKDPEKNKTDNDGRPRASATPQSDPPSMSDTEEVVM